MVKVIDDQFRAQNWNDFTGQSSLKERLSIHIRGALEHNERLDHILLNGPPGMGKSTIAQLIATAMGVKWYSYTLPVKDKAIVQAMELLPDNGIIFLDEIHNSPKKQQEWLLPILHDGCYQLDSGIRVPIPHDVTFIGATTESKGLIAPLQDRFVIKPPFEEYTDIEMSDIVIRMGKVLGVNFNSQEALKLAAACAGIPRAVKQFAKMGRDLKTSSATKILKACGLTLEGLDSDHLRYLDLLASNGSGKAGLAVITNLLDLPKDRIEGLERLLRRRGFIELTGTGREITGSGIQIIGKGQF